MVTALLLGWNPGGPIAAAVPAILLATVAFSGLGLLLAGLLRAEVTLAAANGLYLVLLLLGGMIFPLSKLPGGLRAVAEGLPAGALSDALHGALTAGASVAGPGLDRAGGLGGGHPAPCRPDLPLGMTSPTGRNAQWNRSWSTAMAPNRAAT